MATVAEVLSRKGVHTISPKNSLRDAASRMAEKKIGSLLVVSESHYLEGIITERDIIRAIADMADLDSTVVEEYMSRNPIVVRPEDSLVIAAQKMIHHGIRHLPVVDSAGKLLGVLSIRDVLRHLIGEHEFP
jgi:CBS domain-containing protein